MLRRDTNELGKEVVAQVLQLVPDLTGDVGHEAIPNFLFNWRGSEAQDSGALGSLGILVEEEVRHNQIVVVALVSVVTLIEDDHVELFYLDEPMHQGVVKLLFCEHEDIKAG